VAVNGVCLTVTRAEQAIAAFDVIEETLRLTNLRELSRGDLVNVERSMRVGDEIGGHPLSGHVVDTVLLDRLDADANKRVLWFRVDERWRPFLLHKGFVALDGASLTIAAVDHEAGEFAVSLIPETIGRTTLGRIEPGARVNVELDSTTQAVVATVMSLFSDSALRGQVLAAAGAPRD
jgi:riboflavin synthase